MEVADDCSDIFNSGYLIVLNGKVLDMSVYLSDDKAFLGSKVHQIINQNVGKDATIALQD